MVQAGCRVQAVVLPGFPGAVRSHFAGPHGRVAALSHSAFDGVGIADVVGKFTHI
jgi:hypothetical protein